MQGTAMSVSLTCAAIFPSQGSRGALESSTSRRLQWRKPQKNCSQKALRTRITAQLELKPPPYQLNSLEPHMSQETLEYHWGKHHRGYVETLNRQITGTEMDEMELEDIITTAYNKGDPLPAFNSAAQVWNHEFFWESMKPGGGGKPTGELLELIERDFGSFERFVEDFKAAASTQFGSGWAWLAYKANRLDVGNAVNPCPSEEDKKLVVVKSPNAVNPLVWDYTPILTIDVWEHAYYLDYQNRRADYISIFMEKLVSWEVVSTRLEMAKARATNRELEEERKRREEEEGKVADTDTEDPEEPEDPEELEDPEDPEDPEEPEDMYLDSELEDETEEETEPEAKTETETDAET